jgi:long-chain acyl-CoA synthetase
MSSGRIAQDTLPKLLKRNFERFGDKKVAMRKKIYGIWKSYTWKDYYENVKYFSLGLVSLGLEPGDKVTILGDNDPQWFWAELATQAAGGTALGIFTDSAPAEVKYITDHSDSKFVVARDQEQVDKMLDLKGELPKLKRVIYWDPLGLASYHDPILMSFEKVMGLGRSFEEAHPQVFEENVEKGNGEDIACFCYTSGTTGLPKGVMIPHRGLIAAMQKQFGFDPWSETDEYVSYMSPAWSPEQALGITGGLLSALTVNFLEEPETVNENIREIGPDILAFSSRLWESLVSTIQAKITDASSLKRLCYNLAFPVGYKVADLKFEKKEPNLFWKALYAICNQVVFRPLRDKHGVLKNRYSYTAGAVLSPDAFRFFRAMGLNLKQIFASTEAMTITLHRDDDIRPETVGELLPETEGRITDEGEIAVRSECVVPGYYKNPEETEKALKNGWFYSGDGGHIDETGHLIYWDRVVDLLELADGSKFSPQYIEGRLKFSPYIKDIMAMGGKERAYITAIINIDFANVGRWAEAHHIPYTTFADLSQKPQVVELIRKDTDKVNRYLPESARVRKWVLLHKEFDPDEAELTRSRKLRRPFIEERYRGLVSALYGEETEFAVEAEVRYRDGRKGVLRTPLKINLSGSAP